MYFNHLKKTLLLFFLFIFCKGNAFAQDKVIDSLRTVIKTQKDDTNKVNNLLLLTFKLRKCKPAEALKYGDKALSISKKIGFMEGEIKSHLEKKKCFYWLNNYQNARQEAEQAVAIAIRLNKPYFLVESYYHLGDINFTISDYVSSLKNYLYALRYARKEKVRTRWIDIYLQIGDIYFRENNFDRALEYFNEALNTNLILKDSSYFSEIYNSIAKAYSKQEKYVDAIENYKLSLKYALILKDTIGVISSYNNLGIAHKKIKKYNEAIANYTISYKLLLITKPVDSLWLSFVMSNIGTAFTKLNKYTEAKKYLLDALYYLKKVDDKEGLIDTYNNFYELYLAQNDFKKALEYHIKYVALRDSTFTVEKSKQLAELQETYNSEKKDFEIKVLNQQNKIKETEIKKQRIIRNSFIAGFIVLLGLVFLAVRNYSKKQRVNKLLSNQNEMIFEEKARVENLLVENKKKTLVVEEKNHEITQSIEYALLIQRAILPQQKIVKENLENSFILYMPKDIVAGDFYWMENVQSANLPIGQLANEAQRKSELTNQQIDTSTNCILFAACDCTGHGVPGAMVSVVCHNALNRAVREFGLTKPSDILDKTAELVIENFSKSEDEIKDGMDISLCSLTFNKVSNFVKAELQWAGANNPLWLIKDGKLIQTKADKQPIGKYEDNHPFTNHTFELNKGDSIYIFSDGFADQFGGETGQKKLTRKRFQELMLSIQNIAMTEQGKVLEKFINEYKKDIEQIDDILVMGVQV